MRDTVYLYLRYIGISVRGQMQYRGSFVMQTAGQFLVTGLEFLTLLALFDRFGNLPGWTLPQAAVLYGMVHVTFSFSDATARGFDRFGDLVKSGDFDRLLLRPRSTVLQLAGQELTLRRIGRLSQGLAVLAWGIFALHLSLTPARFSLMLAAIFGGGCLFYGLVVLQATAAFWTTESLELFNILTYGGTTAVQFPISIYRPWLRRFFTFVVPLACVNYLPAQAILGRRDPLGSLPLFQWLSPLLGVAFLVIALQVWKVGVRHYRSTGS